MNDLAVVEPKPMELSVQEVKNHVQKIQNLMGELMNDGEHYGASFPGDTKKNLLKPGADKLMFMFRLRPDFHQDIKELSNGHREVFTRCEIYHIESNQKIAEGVGSASTMESKYRWRNAARKCPYCGKEAIIKGKEEYGGGWICFGKKGGCGAKFQDDDPTIESQEVGKVENPDIADTYNTVIKISKKRAYVDATITACAASDIFTQDAEDFKNAAETAESLAKEAMQENKQPQKTTVAKPAKSSSAKPVSKPDERTLIVNEIAEIMKSLSPDALPFFTETEKEMERTIIKGTVEITTLRNQRDRLRKELEKRKAEYEPIPFTNPEVPAMYQEQESEEGNSGTAEDDGFVDDIPWREGTAPKNPSGKTTGESSTERSLSEEFHSLANREVVAANKELDIF